MKFDTFAMGLGRSGSMALTNIIQQHPDINYPNEEKNGLLLHMDKVDVGTPAKVNVYLSHVPEWHFKNMDKLFPLLSKQRMLHLVRNPYDVMVGLYNSQLYQYLGEIPANLENDFFDVNANYIFCSHPAITAPMSTLFKSNYCILFEELATSIIDDTAKRLYQWLAIDSNFKANNTQQLAYSNRFIFLNQLPLNIELSGQPFSLQMTRNKLPPAPGNRSSRSKFVHIARVSLHGQSLSKWLSLDNVHCWLDVQKYSVADLNHLIMHANDLSSAITVAFEQWHQTALVIEHKIQQQRIDTIPTHAKKKLYDLNKNGVKILSKFKPEINDVWGFD